MNIFTTEEATPQRTKPNYTKTATLFLIGVISACLIAYFAFDTKDQIVNVTDQEEFNLQ